MKLVLFIYLFFSIILLDSILMVKFHFGNQKACLINWNHETYTVY